VAGFSFADGLSTMIELDFFVPVFMPPCFFAFTLWKNRKEAGALVQKIKGS
jgi:hypothetical protein